MTKDAKPSKAVGAFWSRQKIKERHADDQLFWMPPVLPKPAVPPETAPAEELPFVLDEGQLKAASYNLKMGSEVYVTPVSESDAKSVQMLTPGQAFVIPAGQFAFLLTHEAVKVPPDAIALVALRAIELKFKGMINVSGFHIDPGYNGRLIFAVYNASPGSIHLREGQVLFEIFFADLDRETDLDYTKSGSNTPMLRIEPRFIQSFAGEFQTLKGLDAKIDDVESELDGRIHTIEKEQSIIRWASALLLGAIIAFGVRECSLPANAAVPILVHGDVHG
ncbi:hypothetical protein LC612_34045 [Nostoc sp. CHAB 5834]|nr:hypothetical protein [Nostoc sp. CHAB 5834]